MSIATEIERLQTSKAAIKTAIEEKGVIVGDGTIDTYAEKIDEIESGDYDQGYEDGKNSVTDWLYYASEISFAKWNSQKILTLYLGLKKHLTRLIDVFIKQI